jgi:hypothetical protein
MIKRPELKLLDLLLKKGTKIFFVFFSMLNRFRNYKIFLGAVASFIFVIPSEKFQ